MSLQVQCPQCAKQFNAKPELAGKRVKCSQCGGVIAIPGGTAAAAPGAVAKQPPAAAPRPAAAQRPTAPPKMAPPMQPATPQMGSMLDLLGDSKLGELKAATFARQGEILCPNCQEVGPMGAAVCVKCGYDYRDGKIIGFEEVKKANPKVQALIRALLVALLIIVITGITNTFVALVATKQLTFLANPIAKFTEAHKDFPLSWINFGYAGLFVGMVLMVLFYFSILADAFRAKPAFGWMFLFVPGFAVYFLATHWKDTWWTFLCFTFGTWLMAIGLLVQMNSYVEPPKLDPTKKKKKKSEIEVHRWLAAAEGISIRANGPRGRAVSPQEYAAVLAG